MSPIAKCKFRFDEAVVVKFVNKAEGVLNRDALKLDSGKIPLGC